MCCVGSCYECSAPTVVAPGNGMTSVVETHNLTKRYGKQSSLVAVSSLNLIVRRGETYGFLGPNGAGKSTTLRILLGLVKPTSGSAKVLGEVPGTSSALSRVGALIESPAFYPYLSGRDNLRFLARRSGKRIAEGRVEEVLGRVGLKGRAKDKFKGYSLGMKQRLGVSAALLSDPELLILDEPTSGLDPRGATEMRKLLASLGGEKTVLFSSHLLGEVEQLADRVGIIHKGSLVAEGSVTELTGKANVLVHAKPLKEAAKIAEQLTEVEEVRIVDNTLRLVADPEDAPHITRKLVAADLDIFELGPCGRSLEDVFLELTERDEPATRESPNDE